MRKIQKIFIGMFLGGVLLGGIGSGIAFAEFSSLHYAGKKLVGTENLVTRDFDYAFDPSLGKIAVSTDYYNLGNSYGDELLEADSTVPEGTVRYQVTFNEQAIRPYLFFDEAERLQGRLVLRARDLDSGFGIWMECKDQLLAELKQKKISNYQAIYIEDIRIRVNPATLPYVVDETW